MTASFYVLLDSADVRRNSIIADMQILPKLTPCKRYCLVFMPFRSLHVDLMVSMTPDGTFSYS